MATYTYVSKEQELWEAVRHSDMSQAWKLLLGGANPNAIDETNGFTPLIYVCADGNIALAMLLFTRGADINARDNIGQTSLHKAAMNDHMRIVTFLLKANAKLDILDKMNRSAEGLAFQHGHLPIFRLLVGVKGGAVEKRSSLISTASDVSAKIMKKEEAKRDREQKKLDQKESTLLQKENELKEKIEALSEQKEMLQAIPEAQRSKKDIQNLIQVTNRLNKLQLKSEENVNKIRLVRSTSFDNHPADKGQAWIEFVKSK